MEKQAKQTQKQKGLGTAQLNYISLGSHVLSTRTFSLVKWTRLRIILHFISIAYIIY